jgi:hypothetical protein
VGIAAKATLKVKGIFDRAKWTLGLLLRFMRYPCLVVMSVIVVIVGLLIAATERAGVASGGICRIDGEDYVIFCISPCLFDLTVSDK